MDGIGQTLCRSKWYLVKLLNERVGLVNLVCGRGCGWLVFIWVYVGLVNLLVGWEGSVIICEGIGQTLCMSIQD